MTDIFISYASEDREAARYFAEALGQEGWDVWWDREIPAGESFESFIEARLGEAAAVIVLWSKTSVDSIWVRAEAAEALKQDKLIPVLVNETDPPLVFRQIQMAALAGWTGARDAPAYLKLVADLTARIGAPAAREVVADSSDLKVAQNLADDLGSNAEDRPPSEGRGPEGPATDTIAFQTATGPEKETKTSEQHETPDIRRHWAIAISAVVFILAAAAGGFFWLRSSPPPQILVFKADPPVVTKGEESEISWVTEHADRVILRINSDEQQVDTSVNGRGSRSIRPLSRTEAQLTAESADGVSQELLAITVREPKAPPPRILSYLSDRRSIEPGESATLSWRVENAREVELKPLGQVDAVGSRSVKPSKTSDYLLVARGIGGQEVSDTRTIVVTAPPAAPPQIASFRPDDPVIKPGGKTVLRWRTENASRVTLDGVNVKTDSSKTVSPGATATYFLKAWNSAGQAAESRTDVKVDQPPAPQATWLVVTGGGRPLEDRRVRDALAYAVPWADLLAKLGFEKGVTIFEMPYGDKGYSLVKYPYAPDRTKRLLAEAGYPDGLSVYLYVANEKMASIGKFVVDSFARVGIRADLQVIDRDPALERVKTSQASGSKTPVLFLDFEKR